MAIGNDTGTQDSVCPEQQVEWKPWLRSMGLGLFVFSTAYYTLTIFWWRSRRNHPFLKKRNFHLMVLSAIGGYLEIVLVCLGPYLGRNALPCDLFLWFSHFLVPLAAGTLAVRLVLFRNHSIFRRALMKQRQASPSIAFESIAKKSFWSATSDWLQDRFCLVPEHDAAVTDSESDELQKSSQMARMTRLFLGTTRPYSALVLSLFIFVAIVSIVVKYVTVSPYGEGCYGCHISASDIAQFCTQIVLISVVGVYMLMKVRNELDPLGIVRELKICLICAIMAASGAVVTVIDPNDLRKRGEFDWLHIVTIWLILFHTIQCPYQVLKTYQSQGRFMSMLHSKESAVDVSLDDILHSKSGYSLFEQYLASEFSIESLYFIDAVKRFKEKFSEESVESRKRLAGEIYESYLREKSMLEVNVSGEVRRQVKIKLITTQVKPDVFDLAVEEVKALLVNDSLPRFLKSPMFKEWALLDTQELVPNVEVNSEV